MLGHKWVKKRFTGKQSKLGSPLPPRDALKQPGNTILNQKTKKG